ncbi:hypothetical protein GQ43DRAFT_158537 [Delitschia confertaspora ATCC 74209]|uniref:Uncharacterized protein n=1 Tax=Delitschia confertaspora ATCC 74209 TaxID=1513339 RepID=A0A9P4JZ67_9PLEO|nr:hypothetical protein GQ43DRAFT_158537 [Delitschia confertaspora ATCC 74209]
MRSFIFALLPLFLAGAQASQASVPVWEGEGPPIVPTPTRHHPYHHRPTGHHGRPHKGHTTTEIGYPSGTGFPNKGRPRPSAGLGCEQLVAGGASLSCATALIQPTGVPIFMKDRNQRPKYERPACYTTRSKAKNIVGPTVFPCYTGSTKTPVWQPTAVPTQPEIPGAGTKHCLNEYIMGTTVFLVHFRLSIGRSGAFYGVEQDPLSMKRRVRRHWMFIDSCPPWAGVRSYVFE